MRPIISAVSVLRLSKFKIENFWLIEEFVNLMNGVMDLAR